MNLLAPWPVRLLQFDEMAQNHIHGAGDAAKNRCATAVAGICLSKARLATLRAN